jgi:hypothetical protein
VHIPAELFPVAAIQAYFLSTTSYPTSPYQILPSSSRSAALITILSSLAKPEDTVLLQSPAPAYVYEALDTLGLGFVTIPNAQLTGLSTAPADVARSTELLTRAGKTSMTNTLYEQQRRQTFSPSAPSVDPLEAPDAVVLSQLIKQYAPVAVLLFPSGSSPAAAAATAAKTQELLSTILLKKHKCWIVADTSAQLLQQHRMSQPQLDSAKWTAVNQALMKHEKPNLALQAVAAVTPSLCMCSARDVLPAAAQQLSEQQQSRATLGKLHHCRCGELNAVEKFKRYVDMQGNLLTDDPVVNFACLMHGSRVLKWPEPPVALRGTYNRCTCF